MIRAINFNRIIDFLRFYDSTRNNQTIQFLKNRDNTLSILLIMLRKIDGTKGKVNESIAIGEQNRRKPMSDNISLVKSLPRTGRGQGILKVRHDERTYLIRRANVRPISVLLLTPGLHAIFEDDRESGPCPLL